MTADNLECFTLETQSEVNKEIKLVTKFLGSDTPPDGRPVKEIVMTGESWLKKVGYK